jgi:hypothetical protein
VDQTKSAADAEDYAMAANLKAEIQKLAHTKLGKLPDSEVCPS